VLSTEEKRKRDDQGTERVKKGVRFAMFLLYGKEHVAHVVDVG